LVDDREIDELLALPKRITEPPSKKWREEDSQRRKDFRLESFDGTYKFRAFARQSIVYAENFSIGLEYEPASGDDSMILIRCNGPHGDYNGQLQPEHPHFHPHVHKASSRALLRGERAEKYATRTTDFLTAEQAVAFFLNVVNVSSSEREQFFREELERSFDSRQGFLFDETEN